jgi:hypothetical protein
MMRRIERRHKLLSDRKAIVRKSERSKAFNEAFSTFKWELHDPCEPRYFRLNCILAKAAQDNVDRLWKDWQVLPEEDQTLQLREEINQAVNKWQSRLDMAFHDFCVAVIPNVPGKRLTYDKKSMDKAFLDAIGSIGSPGSGIFEYQGLKLSLKSDAALIFSLYMSRKGFKAANPFEALQLTDDFLRFISVPAPDPTSTSGFRSRSRMVACISRIAKLFFRRNGYVLRPSNSGKSCLENPLSQGGKRTYLYGGHPSTYRGVTRAVTILTGGKLRTISVSSVENEKFADLNNFMFSRLRCCKWLVSGRTVGDWVEDCLATEEWDEFDDDDFLFSSGDLKNATNTFSSLFTEEVVSVLADQFPEFDKKEMFESITRASFFDDDLLTLRCVQKRGQLMGSDFSFPILCLISFVIVLETHGLSDHFLSIGNDKLAHKFIKDLTICGVNGDDVVSWGKKESGLTPGQRWASVVPLTGGIPEPTKSPEHKNLFTINSQLWKLSRDADGQLICNEVGTVLPALCKSICEGAHKSPQESWSGIVRSPFMTRISQTWLQLDVGLMPDLPTSWGGLSLVKPKYDHLWLKRVLWSKHSRSINWIDLGILDPSLDGLVSETNYGTLVHAALQREELDMVNVVEGFVPKDWLKRTLSTRFSSNKLIFWSNGEKNRKTFFSLKSKVDNLYNSSKFNNWKVVPSRRSARNKVKSDLALWRDDELKKLRLACRATLEAEEHGFVYVPRLKILSTDEDVLVKNSIFVDVSSYSEERDKDGNLTGRLVERIRRVKKSTREIFVGAFKFTGSLVVNRDTASEDAPIE